LNVTSRQFRIYFKFYNRFIRVVARDPSTSTYVKLIYRNVSFNQSTIRRPPAREVKMLNQSSHRMPGFLHSNEPEERDSEGGAVGWGHLKRAKVNDMVGGDRKPHMKSMKPRASRRLHIKRCKPP
jgi:hypothetical protein